MNLEDKKQNITNIKHHFTTKIRAISYFLQAVSFIDKATEHVRLTSCDNVKINTCVSDLFLLFMYIKGRKVITQ